MPRRTALRPDEYAVRCGATIVRVADLAAAGLARSTIAQRCRAGGPWRRLLPGVVKLSNGPPTRPDRRQAALLYAGPGAVLTGADALELHGIEQLPRASGPVHVLVGENCRRSGAGRVLAERTARLPVAEAGRWPLAPVVRATLDFTRRTSDRNRVRAVIAEVVQRDRCTPGQLRAELDAGCGWGSALPRSVLREVGEGVRSVAEAAARELVQRSGLPAPMWNPALHDRLGRFLCVPDAWFDEVGLAWEIDSKAWHLAPADYERTVARRSVLATEQVIVMSSLPTTITADPAAILRELHAHYALAGSRPRPPVTAIPQTSATDGTFVHSLWTKVPLVGES